MGDIAGRYAPPILESSDRVPRRGAPDTGPEGQPPCRTARPTWQASISFEIAVSEHNRLIGKYRVGMFLPRSDILGPR